MHRRRSLKELLTASYAANLFMLLLTGFYIVAPLLIYITTTPNILYIKTAGLALTTLIGIYIGKRLPLFSPHFRHKHSKIKVYPNRLVILVYFLFVTFIAVTTVTANSIPLLSAMQGLGSSELSDERGEFLKGREGGWIVLLYLSSMLSSTIIPYTVLLSHYTKSYLSRIFALTFLVYSSMFLVKALFLNLLLPLISYGIDTNPKQSGRILAMVAGSVGFLLLMIWLSGFGSLESTTVTDRRDYFTTAYIPTGVLDYFIYRAFSVPVFSVVDTLHVHDTLFKGELFLGSTSSFISALTGAEKINIERFVAEYQYGGWNDFANSNVAFFVDGYVNFGWIGVLVFGVIVGQIFRMFAKSNDVAFRALSLLFSYQLLASPLIQMLLSNGWLFIFAVMAFFKVLKSEKPQVQTKPL